MGGSVYFYPIFRADARIITNENSHSNACNCSRVFFYILQRSSLSMLSYSIANRRTFPANQSSRGKDLDLWHTSILANTYWHLHAKFCNSIRAMASAATHITWPVHMHRVSAVFCILILFDWITTVEKSSLCFIAVWQGPETNSKVL